MGGCFGDNGRVGVSGRWSVLAWDPVWVIGVGVVHIRVVGGGHYGWCEIFICLRG